jgi:HK97 family phage prohead protease
VSIERRDFKGACEIRAGASGKPMIAGYAAVFNTWSQNLGGFVEQIDRRAFDKTLQEADVRALGNHDKNWLLGRTGNGTMRLSSDSNGLEYEIDVNLADPDGQRALAKVERGDWDGASFGFRTIRDEWDFRKDPRERRLLETALRDVGPVTFPAYMDTSSVAPGAARSLATALGVELRDAELALSSGSLDELLVERERIVISETRAPGDVAWGPEDGFQDLICDVTSALNVAEWRYSCFDAATSLDRVLVRDYTDGGVYVVPIAIGSDSEPIVSEPADWTPVEEGWVEVGGIAGELADAFDTARAYAGLPLEERAGRVLSQATVAKVQMAVDHLQTLLLDAQPSDTEALQADGLDDTPDDGEGNALTQSDVERRLLELKGPRRYSADA